MKRLTSHLYFWVLSAIAAGVVLGAAAPEIAVTLKPLCDGFIALVKMLIPPIIFCTVVLGIAGAGDMKKVGRVGAKTLIYFEAVTTSTISSSPSIWRAWPARPALHARPAPASRRTS